MLKKAGLGVFVLFLAAVSGCATTGRNYQTDIDALNAKVAAMQNQLSEKDGEIARLQERMQEDESALLRAENEKRALADQLEAASAKAVPASTRPDSDLK